jgi:hypothetical protein
MNTFIGIAELHYRGETRTVHLCLDLDQNVIEIRHSMPDSNRIFSIAAEKDWHKSPVTLTNIHIHTPIGELTRDQCDGFFVSRYNPGTQSIYDSTLGRALTLRGKEAGLTKLVLHPKNSRLELTFRRYDSTPAQYELFYQGAGVSLSLNQPLQLHSSEATVAGDNGTVSVEGHQSLRNYEEHIRLALGVLLGGPMTIRSILDGDTLIINLSAHEEASAGRLFKHHDDSGPLLQGLVDFFLSLSAPDWSRWTRATYFFLQGLGGKVPLEIRAINLYTFLEIVDNTDALDKGSVAKLLDITNDEADLLCRVRNRLTHHGENLGTALIDSEGCLARFKTPLNNSVFTIDASDKQRTGIAFFFRFAMLLNRLWITRANYTRPWNDYSEYSL